VTVLVIDFETTGIVKDGNSDFLAQPGIVQIGAVLIGQAPGRDTLEMLTEFNTLINPEIAQWEPGAMKVHGLTPEKVASKPTFFEIFPKLAEFAKGCDAWVGYNNKFDKDVLWYQLLRYGFERHFPWPPHDIDIMKIASAKLNIQGKRGQKWPKLVDAYRETFGRDYSGAHDAMADVRATGELYIEWHK
jgi:DNA polymerase-3 subunit epsilon